MHQPDTSPVTPPLARAEETGQLTFGEIAGFLRYYWRSVLLALLLPLLAAAAYVRLTPPLYTARAELLLEVRTPSLLKDEIQMQQDRRIDSSELESQVVVLRSERIARPVIERLGLRLDPASGELIVSGETASRPSPRPRVAAAGAALVAERRTMDAFLDNLDVRRNGLSYAVDIRFTSRSPELAGQVANAVTSAFLEDQIASRAEAMKASGKWLEERIEQLRREMNEAQLNVQRFRVKRDYRLLDNGAAAPSAAGREGSEQAARAPADGDEKARADADKGTLEELESRALTYQSMFRIYLQAYTESVQRQSFPVANARIITPASVPLQPSWPKPALILMFALLVGVVVGFGQALLRYQARSMR